MLNNLKNTYFISLNNAATVAFVGVSRSKHYILIILVARVVVGIIFFLAATTATLEALALVIIVVTTHCSDVIPLPPTLPGLQVTIKK